MKKLSEDNTFLVYKCPYCGSGKITINKTKLKIEGVSKLKGNVIEATDLRAGACLLLAALKAEGETIIKNADYILRGYENITQKLQNIGAKIELKEI